MYEQGRWGGVGEGVRVGGHWGCGLGFGGGGLGWAWGLGLGQWGFGVGGLKFWESALFSG